MATRHEDDDTEESVSEIYYSTKKDRFDHKYKGKTVRAAYEQCSNWYARNNSTIKVHRKYNDEDAFGKVYTYGVTAVDLEFEELIAQPTSFKRIDPNIHDYFAKSAVSMLTKTTGVMGQTEYTYYLPIVGHVLTKRAPKGDREPKKNKAPKTVSFCPYSVYTWTKGDWKVVRAFNSWDIRPIPNLPPSAKNAQRLPTKMKTEKKMSVKNKKTRREDAIVVDLLAPTMVSAIGLRSEFPEFVKKTPPVTPSRQLVDPSKVSYVTSYVLYYWVLGESKWVKMGTFQGNDSILQELVVDLVDHYNTQEGLYTRFLKFVPINFHISPKFEIEVYGNPFAKTNVKHKTVNADKSEDVETVKYSMKVQNGPIAAFDGKGPYTERDRKWGRSQRRSFVIRGAWKSTTKTMGYETKGFAAENYEHGIHEFVSRSRNHHIVESSDDEDDYDDGDDDDNDNDDDINGVDDYDDDDDHDDDSCSNGWVDVNDDDDGSKSGSEDTWVFLL